LPYRDPAKNQACKDRWRLANPEKQRAAIASWRSRNKEHIRQQDAEYRRVNSDKEAKRHARYRKNNKEKMAAASARWKRENPGKVNAKTARRTAAKLQATPPWADLDAIAAFYIEAARLTRDTGIPHEVDHYYPLQGKISCGLHVPWNLKIATRTANRQKGNKMPEEHFRAAA
jgi:hypothetical protein